MTSFFKKTASVVTTLALVGGMALPLFSVHAAQITTASDTLSTLKAGEAADHELKMVLPGGIISGSNMSVYFADGFDGSSVSYTDVDFAVGDSNNCSSATFTEKTLAATASGSTWGADIALQGAEYALQIDSGTDVVAADRCVRIRIGTNAVTGVTGTDQIVNPATPNNDPGYSVYINSNGGTDITYIAIPILTDNEVQVTASVTPQISFALSENSLQFGTLTVGNDRYATNAGGNTSETAGLELTTSTNAANGYNITVLGNTLTSTSGYTVDAIGGTPANLTSGEKFGLRANVTSGTGTPTTPYNSVDYAFTAGSAQQLVSATTPVNTTTIDVYYGANISATTQAADYSTTHTYVVTGNF
jgi:hypothetical protein